MSDDETKQCPFCAEYVRKEAKICRFCHMDFTTGKLVGTTDSSVLPTKEIQARSGVADGVKIGFGMFIVLPLFIVVGLALLLGFCSGSGSQQTSVSAPTPARSGSDAIALSKDKGWRWAQDNAVDFSGRCEGLANPDEREGCIAYANAQRK